MATRFWVGALASAQWGSASSWSVNSGGAGGASVPTAVDDVIFDANSGNFIANIVTAASANSITYTAAAGFARVVQIALQAPLTTNTLTTIGTTGNNRMLFRGSLASGSSTVSQSGIAHNLTINGAVSISDCDFRDIYVTGSAAPISGTRIGDLRGCSGITFSAPKTVYWNAAFGGNWTDNAWATSEGGTVSTDNFPLAQDTATIVNTGLDTSASVSLGLAIPYTGTVDMSARSNAMSFSVFTTFGIYGDFKNGSGTTLTGSNTIEFVGRNIQTITSAGQQFGGAITIDSYGGTVQLADALSLPSSQSFIVTNGTFNTNGYTLGVGNLSSNNSNVRRINFGSSLVNTSGSTPINFFNNTNLTFNAGTSEIRLAAVTNSIAGGATGGTGVTFYNVKTVNIGSTITIQGINTFNNLTVGTGAANSITTLIFADNQTITGTLATENASVTARGFFRSDTSLSRTLTVNSLSGANDCDFRDITIAGAAAGTSLTRAGDCGNNSGITFPSPKTVYWNLAGTQNWSSTGWATSSGGSPAENNFPLAQDTAVFDNAGSADSFTINNAWNIGTFNASARTNAMTFSTSTGTPLVYGNWLFGTGVTSSSTTGAITFFKNGTQTITSNGVQFNCPITINHPSGNVQLADALSLSATSRLTVSAGTFNAVSYNVTTGLFSGGQSTIRMGSGTWTLTGVGTIWGSVSSLTTVIPGTSTIVLSDNSTTNRIFSSTAAHYNKITIGGTTSNSTTSFTSSGGGTIGELASTKTVAHRILFQSTSTFTIGKWSVTGTAGNIVTVGATTSGSAFSLNINGPAPQNIDYLSISSCAVTTTSPGEFYVGGSSTNGGTNTNVLFSYPASPRTLYWRGGTGNWTSTANWSIASGGGGGAAIPTSLDSVIFNSASHNAAYTVTMVGTARCAAFTMAGPASGSVTITGSVPIYFHGNVSFAASGITRTWTGAINLCGTGSHTFTTNGLVFANAFNVIGLNSTEVSWTLGSALNNGTSAFNATIGTFNTSASNYSVTAGILNSVPGTSSNKRSIILNGSTLTLSGVNFSPSTNLTLNAGTSSIISPQSSGIGNFNQGTGFTFYNVSFTSTSQGSGSFTGSSTFNNLSIAGLSAAGLTQIDFSGNHTINGTLTLGANAGSNSRIFLSSSSIGTTRTLTVNALAAGAADYDFRDISIAGAAAPISGTRFGDCKGNFGITFPAAKTVYYRQTGIAIWPDPGSWSASVGGAANATLFPLAQDTAVYPAEYPASGSFTSIGGLNYNIGTIDMSLRTSNTMTLDTGSNQLAIYGNWINGTGITIDSTGGNLNFVGRGNQRITSAGVTFTKPIVINTPGGSVTLQDTLSTNTVFGLTVTAGTFDAATSNVNLPLGTFNGSGTNLRTIAIGSGTWTINSTSPWNTATSTNLTITGTGTINLTSAVSKLFVGGGISYSGITLNNGGAGALTISGSNAFKNITNTYSATGAATIIIGTTTQRVTQFTGTGEAGRVLTIQGTSATSPGTLILTTGRVANTSNVVITGVRAYSSANGLSSTWYAGANSINGGSLGWIFGNAPGPVTNSGNFFMLFY
jgi:hypothetical protein